MAKITSLDDLRKIKKNQEDQINLREKAEHPESLVQVKVGMATSGIAAGAKEIFTFFEMCIRDRTDPEQAKKILAKIWGENVFDKDCSKKGAKYEGS